MGLLKHLLFWPYTGPKFLTEFSLRQVEGVAREELTDDSGVKADLLELQLQLELGDIDDDEYLVREAALMQRLREIRDWRERLGMSVSGGPVRVQRDPTDADAASPPDADAAKKPVKPQVADPRGGVEVDLTQDWE